MAFTLFTQSFGSANANARVTISEAGTGTPAIILSSATGGIISDRGITQTDASGSISVYIDTAKSWKITLVDESYAPTFTGALSTAEYAQFQALTLGGGNFLSPDQVLPIALYGDSRANVGSNGTNNQYDLRVWTSAVPTGTVGGGNLVFRSGAAVQSYYPAAKIVANCGVSGDTLYGASNSLLARETAGASATRKSLDDAWSVGARVLIFRAGINTISSQVTAGYSQATTDTIISQRQDLLQRAVNRGFMVIDEGEAGYDYVGDGVNFPQSRIDAIRQTIAAVNTAAAAFASSSGGAIRYLNVAALVCDSTGQWLPGMCEDTATPGQRVHPSIRAADLIGQAEAALLSSMFRACPPNYTRYGNGLSDTGNLIPNADLTSSSAGLGTGYTLSYNGTTPVRTPSITTRKARRWQDAVFSFGGANASNYGTLNIPLPIQSGGSIAVAAGQVYGFEVDIMIDDGNGGAPPVADGGNSMNARIRIYGAAGNVYYDAIATTLGSPTPGQPWFGKAIWNPITMFEASATLTSSTAWQISYSSAAGSQFRISVSNPRMVRIS